MPRLVYLSGLALLLLTGAFLLTHDLLGPWPGVTEANARRIQEGMTNQQVEAILRGPPDPDKWGDGPAGRRIQYWVEKRGTVTVWSKAGRVMRVEWKRSALIP